MPRFVCLLTVKALFIAALMTSFSHADDNSLLIVRGNEDYPPDEVVVDGQLSGFHIELINAVAAQINQPVEFQSVPWSRALKMIRYGKADAITYISKNSERSHYVDFLPGNIISHSVHYLLANKDNFYARHYQGDFTELKGAIIGVQRGYSYGETFDTSDQVEKLVISRVDQMLALLSNCRIDMAVLSMAEYQELKHADGFKDLILLPTPLSSRPNYLGFGKSPEQHQQAERFAAAMKKFKQTQAYQQLLKKYHKQPVPIPAAD